MLDTPMGEALDVLYPDAVVHDPVVDDRDVRDVGRVVDENRILTPVEHIAVESPRGKTLRPHERPETDVDVEVAAAIAIAGIPADIGRQRRPANAIAIVGPAERDPGRTPHAPGHPYPAVVGI